MTEDNQYYRRDPRITFESALLLVIFVGAALFIATLAYTMAPWEGDDSAAGDAAVAETQDTGDTAAADGDEIAGGAEEPAP